MVTTAEGLRMFQTGVGQLGAGMSNLGQQGRLSKGAQSLREEDPGNFVGGQSGREQAATAFREGQISTAQSLRQPQDPYSKMQSLAGDIVKAKTSGDAAKASQLSEVFNTYGEMLEAMNVYKFAHTRKKSSGGGGGKRVTKGDGKVSSNDISNAIKDLGDKWYETPEGRAAYADKFGIEVGSTDWARIMKAGRDITNDSKKLEKATTEEERAAKKLVLDQAKLDWDKQKFQLSKKQKTQEALDKEAKKAEEYDNPTIVKAHTVGTNADIFKDTQGTWDDTLTTNTTRLSRIEKNIGNLPLPDYVKQATYNRAKNMIETGADVSDMAKDFKIVAPAKWSKEAMDRGKEWTPSSFKAAMNKTANSDDIRVTPPRKGSKPSGAAGKVKDKSGMVYWADSNGKPIGEPIGRVR